MKQNSKISLLDSQICVELKNTYPCCNRNYNPKNNPRSKASQHKIKTYKINKTLNIKVKIIHKTSFLPAKVWLSRYNRPAKVFCLNDSS